MPDSRLQDLKDSRGEIAALTTHLRPSRVEMEVRAPLALTTTHHPSTTGQPHSHSPPLTTHHPRIHHRSAPLALTTTHHPSIHHRSPPPAPTHPPTYHRYHHHHGRHGSRWRCGGPVTGHLTPSLARRPVSPLIPVLSHSRPVPLLGRCGGPRCSAGATRRC